MNAFLIAIEVAIKSGFYLTVNISSGNKGWEEF